MTPFPNDELFPSDDLFPSGPDAPPRRVPRLRVPLEFTGSALATVEQDSLEDVTQCVYAVMATERGSRVEEPDFGITDPTFEQGGMDEGEALLQIATWEPRADVTIGQDIVDLIDAITVEVRG